MFDDAINGMGGNLTKQGSSTLTHGGANGYTGTSTVSGGTLALGVGGSLAATSSLVVNGGTFDVAGNGQTFSAVQLASGTIQNGTVTLNAGNYDLQSGTVSASLAGTAGANKTTLGTAMLSGNNTYAVATSINTGTLTASSATALGSTAAGTTITTWATLAINGVAIGTEAISVSGSGVPCWQCHLDRGNDHRWYRCDDLFRNDRRRRIWADRERRWWVNFSDQCGDDFTGGVTLNAGTADLVDVNSLAPFFFSRVQSGSPGRRAVLDVRAA